MRGVLGRLAGLLVVYACVYGGAWLLHIHVPNHESAWTIVAIIAWFTAAFIVGTIAHELGHAVAVRMVGEQVLAVKLGGKLGRVTFSIGTIPVSIGLGSGGSVAYNGHRLSARRRAVVLAAGPAANILVAPLCLLLPLQHSAAALCMLGILAAGLQNLVPARSNGDGELSDGGKLWRIPARLRADKQVRALLADPDWLEQPGAADVLINGFRLDVPEAEDGLRGLGKQPERVLRLYLQAWSQPDKPEADVLYIVDVLSAEVLVTGELPADTADLAASRAEWVIDHLDSEYPDKRLPLWSAQQTLALARLRQGRVADVRRLCADALAADIDADDRATTLAIVAMARDALLLDGRPQLDEAVALDPDARLVHEAVRVLGGSRESVAVLAQGTAS